jgi:hypothetical protein
MSSAAGSSARPPRAWTTVVATSEGRAERAVQRHVHDLVSSQYQRTSPHADPPSAIMLSTGMWMPHSQHETTAVPPGPGPESAAASGPGSAGRWLRRPARRSAALLTARSGLLRRLQPWLLLVPCQLAAAGSLSTRCSRSSDRDALAVPGGKLTLIVAFSTGASEGPARGDGRTCPQPSAILTVRQGPLGVTISLLFYGGSAGPAREPG